MSQRPVLLSIALASALALVGCSGDAQSAGAVSAESTQSASAEPTTTPSPTDEPEPEPELSSPADPLTVFESSGPGQPYAETVTAAERLTGQDGAPLHQVTADTNDRAVAVEICRSYQTALQTGPQHIHVVDTVGTLLAQSQGGAADCAVVPPKDVGAVPFPEQFSYEEAKAAWQNGMPYYDAFCLNYTPVTTAGISQCEGIENGTVNAVTGEYIGG